MNAAEIEALIEEQFGCEDFPDTATLLRDDGCTHDECLYIKEVFGRKNWQAVAVPEAERRFREDIYYFFSPDAFIYYMPNFLLAMLNSYQDADVMGDYFLGILTDEFAAVHHNVELAFGVRLKFARGQVKAIVAFLEHLWTEYDDDTAGEILLEMGCFKG